eukprot:scpid35402/ scgid21794/ ATP synthase mitochondrial F1 complex assembly factor 2
MLVSGICKRCLSALGVRQSSNFARKKVYKDVSVSSLSGSNEFSVRLDERPLRTPLGHDVIVPSEMAANAVAREWSVQDDEIKPHTMPLTQLVNLAIDQPTKRTDQEIAADILAYLETDTLRCRVEFPDELVALQTKKWDPILKWLEDRFQVQVPSSDNIFDIALPENTVSTIAEHLVNLNKWSRTSLESATTSSKSFATAAALLDGHVDVDEAIAISQLENTFQIDRWGNVEWAHQYDLVALKSSLASAYLVHTWCGKLPDCPAR